MGIAKYNEECRGIVQRYTGEWRQIVERFGITTLPTCEVSVIFNAPDHQTHELYVRELNAYLMMVARNPQAFQHQVSGLRRRSQPKAKGNVLVS
ncbi:putative isoleucine--tRNA ligase, cytoplasmic [Symbiodinium microadriaticum]|uniref:Putative isoleucine--tRNA ligase, cytoplasmic n=1 Tax=Symbiodinium microadriaticum TaxID=2951 RepID=A0A1Q9CJB9_SYMMI|nr:putative isoleucine--tRNA ligase, cytoplasmic [Symbiodinium microadriaticum]